MTLRQAITQARDVYVFAVVRLTDENDSTCGYVHIPKIDVRYILNKSWLQRVNPEWELRDGDLYIG